MAWVVYASFETAPGGTYSNLHIARPDGTEDHRILGDRLHAFSPAWSPDGEWIAFGCWHSGGICLTRPDGSDEFTVPIEATIDQPYYLEWSPDGAWLSFEDFGLGYQSIRFLRVDTWEVLEAIPGKQTFGRTAWAPDGHRAAVRGGGTHVVTPGTAEASLAETDGNWTGNWSTDGKWISYGATLNSIDMTLPDGSRRRPLLESDLVVSSGFWQPARSRGEPVGQMARAHQDRSPSPGSEPRRDAPRGRLSNRVQSRRCRGHSAPLRRVALTPKPGPLSPSEGPAGGMPFIVPAPTGVRQSVRGRIPEARDRQERDPGNRGNSRALHWKP